MRDEKDAHDALKLDLSKLGFRARRGHDLRRSFVTIAQVDGARRDILKNISHGASGDIVSMYTSFPWPTLCAEIAKMEIKLPHPEQQRLDYEAAVTVRSTLHSFRGVSFSGRRRVAFCKIPDTPHFHATKVLHP